MSTNYPIRRLSPEAADKFILCECHPFISLHDLKGSPFFLHGLKGGRVWLGGGKVLTAVIA